MVQSLRFATLDVFTTQPYSGNPLGVVFLPDSSSSSSSSPITQEQKQLIAREFNLSETIFIHPTNQSTPSSRAIDIFTTTEELPFAGHPTIGAASWFLEHSSNEADKANVQTLITKAGPFAISRVPSSQSGDVAAKIAHNVHIHSSRFALSELLRLHPSLVPFLNQSTSQDSFPVFSIVKGMSQVLVELPSLEALAATEAPMGGEDIPCKSVSEGGYLDAGWEGSGLIMVYFHVPGVLDESTGKKVIRSRMFLRNFEDPATGSAASGLASYLALMGTDVGATTEFDIVQGVEMGRRSDISVAVTVGAGGQEKKIETVELRGCAVKVTSGELVI
ncbi:putative phenazine biosynthesis-like protein [Aspergillus sclerotioniger CBS 115572]|uniref:Putative phenazine biosynthesis-like protein n=1 Tax=Aspergillus sclerotioniger CBS 115572 TaxID=1450535 RepID=A0A317WFI5_9EURO|nr:putative phenazine biosynthesis-like protein [Aspergillus sclerotioniger CBS 115572]PWY83768.1 putative phenazine biosynthesis-like protein [Aspergillus sclerotioniger CBS 115572]